MIPKNKYKYHEHIGNYITYELLTEHHNEEDVEKFVKWMHGQTMAIIDGLAAIYSWDYERWIEQGKKTEQGADWD